MNGLRFSNSVQLTETNYNITPPNVEIWRGEIPYKEGDSFPTPDIKKRADEYLTNLNLYRNQFGGILDSVFSWTDYMTNPITNLPNLAICANLPDWYSATEAWVSLLSQPPEIDTVIDVENVEFGSINQKLKELSTELKSCNFAEIWQDVIRCGMIAFGNMVVRVDKVKGGRLKLNTMPLKCWQPFVYEYSPSIIACNLFFNIFTDSESGENLCEFIAYEENGRITKKTFKYLGNEGAWVLGEQVGETEEGEAFEGLAKVSPIVVFKGKSIGGDIFGESQYKYWDASISSAIRNYEAIGVLVEQAKEIIRKLPAGATKTDEYTGVTYQNRTGAIAYTDPQTPPDIEFIKCKVELDQVIAAYKESIARVSRDTGLPASFFDTREINIAASGSALRASMYRTQLMATTMANGLEYQVKEFIIKIALACGIELDPSSWGVYINTGALTVDLKEKSDVIQARVNGEHPTMSIAQAIKEYEGVSMEIAIRKAAALEGKDLSQEVNPKDNKDIIEEGTDTVGGIHFTPKENNDTSDSLPNLVEYPAEMLPL